MEEGNERRRFSFSGDLDVLHLCPRCNRSYSREPTLLQASKRLTKNNIEATFDPRFSGRPPHLDVGHRKHQGVSLADVALGGTSKRLAQLCSSLEEDCKPLLEAHSRCAADAVCDYIKGLFPHLRDQDASFQQQFDGVLERFRLSDIEPTLAGFHSSFFRKLPGPSTLSRELRASASIHFSALLSDGCMDLSRPNDVKTLKDHCIHTMLPKVQRGVLKDVRHEMVQRIDAAYETLQGKMLKQRTNYKLPKWMRNLVKRFCVLVSSTGDEEQEVELFEFVHDFEQMKVELDGLVDPAATTNAAKDIAAGLQRYEREKAVWANAFLDLKRKDKADLGAVSCSESRGHCSVGLI